MISTTMHPALILLLLLLLQSCICPVRSWLLQHHSRHHLISSQPRLGIHWVRHPWQRLATNKCQEGTVEVSRGGDQSFDLHYRVFRPMSLSSQKAAPMVALHGGPSLPSDYLEPLVDVIPYRSIVLYDQLGCGQSDEPPDVSLYSIEYAVDDLQLLLKKLGIRRFHLYGQSFGGILAFEYLKKMQAQASSNNGHPPAKCLSVVLSSTSYSVLKLDQEWERLRASLKEQDSNLDDTGVDQAFQQTHICRTRELPEPLARAYQKTGSTWFGLDCIRTLECQAPQLDDNNPAPRLPSALILRGEHDFCTQACVEKWRDLFRHKFVRYRVLEECSHHALLEKGALYGDTLESFFSEYD